MSYKSLRGGLAVLAALGASAASASPSATTSPPRANITEPAEPPVLQSVVAPSPPVSPPPPPAPPLSGKERSATPTGTPAAWVTTNDYPKAALRESRSGTVGFRLNVGVDGRVVGCTILTSSGSPDLDEATCSLVSHRAVFSPALNAKGKPTQGTYASRVRWVVPEQPEGATLPTSFQLQPMIRIITYTVDVDGTPSECVETENGNLVPPAMAPSPCTMSDKIKPYLDAQGKPVRKKVTVEYTITVANAPK